MSDGFTIRELADSDRAEWCALWRGYLTFYKSDVPDAVSEITWRRLVEFVEYPREQHPFLIATQAHPELKSRPTRPHPLFRGLIAAAMAYKAAERLPVEIPRRDDDVAPVPA